jgi:hypothetical protein
VRENYCWLVVDKPSEKPLVGFTYYLFVSACPSFFLQIKQNSRMVVQQIKWHLQA